MKRILILEDGSNSILKTKEFELKDELEILSILNNNDALEKIRCFQRLDLLLVQISLNNEEFNYISHIIKTVSEIKNLFLDVKVAYLIDEMEESTFQSLLTTKPVGYIPNLFISKQFFSIVSRYLK